MSKLTRMQNLVDPQLLVCNQNDIDPYCPDSMFLVRFKEILISLHSCFANGQWVFSTQLVSYLTGSYPWNLQQSIGWIRALQEPFFDWLQRASSEGCGLYLNPQQEYVNLDLEPEFFPPYINESYSYIKEEWLCLLECTVGVKETLTTICSFEPHPNRVTLVNSNINPTPTFLVIRNRQDWNSIDPWLNHGVTRPLPKAGQVPYEPHNSWQGLPHGFPTRKISNRYNGFLDAKDRIWVWDRVEEHWDVQIPPYGRDNYMRVNENGRIL